MPSKSTAPKTTPATETPAPATLEDAKAAAKARDAAVLTGVTTTAEKPAAKRTPKPTPPKATPKPDPKANGGAPATDKEVAAAVKAANAGPKPNEVKRELAAMVVVAAGEAIKNLPEDELVQLYGGAAPEALAAQVAQWLHYLPLGGVWPEGYVPKPDRSDWR